MDWVEWQIQFYIFFCQEQIFHKTYILLLALPAVLTSSALWGIPQCASGCKLEYKDYHLYTSMLCTARDVIMHSAVYKMLKGKQT